MTRPRVCVAVPCYNQQDTLATTLDSLLSQDYENLFVIVSDDGSTDQTATVAQEYVSRYPDRMQLQVHSINLGITRNVRSIEPLIDGDYVCWFAGDDICLAGKISRQVEALEARPDAVLCYHDLDVFDGATGTSLYRYNDRWVGHTARQGRIAGDLIAYRCFIGAVSVMVRRSATFDIRHRLEMPRVSDWLYLIEVCERGEAIFLDDTLARYRRHAANATNLVDASDEVRTFELVRSLYPAYQKEVATGLTRMSFNYAFKYFLSGKRVAAYEMARHCGGEALRHPRMFAVLAHEAAVQAIRRTGLYIRSGRLTR